MVELDIDMLVFVEHRARSLYAYEGDGPEDLCESRFFLFLSSG